MYNEQSSLYVWVSQTLSWKILSCSNLLGFKTSLKEIRKMAIIQLHSENYLFRYHYLHWMKLLLIWFCFREVNNTELCKVLVLKLLKQIICKAKKMLRVLKNAYSYSNNSKLARRLRRYNNHSRISGPIHQPHNDPSDIAVHLYSKRSLWRRVVSWLLLSKTPPEIDPSDVQRVPRISSNGELKLGRCRPTGHFRSRTASERSRWRRQ